MTHPNISITEATQGFFGPPRGRQAEFSAPAPTIERSRDVTARRQAPEVYRERRVRAVALLSALALSASLAGAKVIGGFNKSSDRTVATAQPLPLESAPQPTAPMAIQAEVRTAEVLPQPKVIHESLAPQKTKEAQVTVEAVKSVKLPPESQAQLEGQLSAIRALQPTYESAAKQVGLPWQVIAALHYRESGNNPSRSVFAGENIGSINPDHGDIRGQTIEENLVQGAEFLKGMAKSVYGVELGLNPTKTELTKAFVAWNRGYMYARVNQSVETSPYAMNGLDQAHLHMTWPNTVAEPQSTRGLPNAQLGALTVAVGLGLDLAS